MSELPHCPYCHRADRVETRPGNGYEYHCNHCYEVIQPDDVTDIAWIDMVSDRMFRDPESVKEQATATYSSECECDWCERGRPGLNDIELDP